MNPNELFEKRLNREKSARKQAENLLEQKSLQLYEANKAKSTFLAMMSHEIRTPLNGILGMAGLLEDTALSSEQTRYVKAITQSGEALLSVLNDILDFSKLEFDKLKLEIIDFDLGKIIDSIIELLGPKAYGKNIALAAFIPPETPTALKGDPGRLRQILINLIGNAIKFTEKGGISVEVKCIEQKQNSWMLHFEIIDTGIGIPADKQHTLFETFSQVDASTTRKHGGTGLGLAISKQLVGLMGGQIGHKHNPNGGSHFWFTARFEQAMQYPEKTIIPLTKSLESLRAIVIDDNEINRLIFRKQLESWKIDVEEAELGQQGLDKMRQAVKEGNPYTLALIDQMMPEMNGLTVGEKIKNDALIKNTNMLLLTSMEITPFDGEAKKVGFAKYLMKPVNQSTLLETILETLYPEEIRKKPKQAPQARIIPQVEYPWRILLAEDSQVNQMLAVTLLKKRGYKIDTAGNGIEAVNAVRKFPYDLILMDIQMPEMDGIEATQKIRTMGEDRANISIIALTANAMKGDREKYLEAGLNDYISKPIDKNALYETLDKWLKDKKPEKEQSQSGQTQI